MFVSKRLTRLMLYVVIASMVLGCGSFIRIVVVTGEPSIENDTALLQHEEALTPKGVE